ncbi:MAG TPA: DUF2627 domain-containing protein [Bacilli bacterium]
MKLIALRFIAVLLLVIPGFAATYGFLAMKDAIFNSFGPDLLDWGKLIFGLFAFVLGVAFIGGWIFFRDRKRNYVATRFKVKKKR